MKHNQKHLNKAARASRQSATFLERTTKGFLLEDTKAHLKRVKEIKDRVTRRVERAQTRRLERNTQIEKLKSEGVVFKGRTPNISFTYSIK